MFQLCPLRLILIILLFISNNSLVPFNPAMLLLTFVNILLVELIDVKILSLVFSVANPDIWLLTVTVEELEFKSSIFSTITRFQYFYIILILKIRNKKLK